MNVVRHQAISVEVEGKFGFLLLDEVGELKVIVSGSENLPSIIPPSNDVIEPSGNFDPWLPRHGGQMLSGDRWNVNKLKPDPFFAVRLTLVPLQSADNACSHVRRFGSQN